MFCLLSLLRDLGRCWNWAKGIWGRSQCEEPALVLLTKFAFRDMAFLKAMSKLGWFLQINLRGRMGFHHLALLWLGMLSYSEVRTAFLDDLRIRLQSIWVHKLGNSVGLYFWDAIAQCWGFSWFPRSCWCLPLRIRCDNLLTLFHALSLHQSDGPEKKKEPGER